MARKEMTVVVVEYDIPDAADDRFEAAMAEFKVALRTGFGDQPGLEPVNVTVCIRETAEAVLTALYATPA